MKIVYPAAHGDGGHAIRHHPPAAPPLWAIYTTPQPDSLVMDLFCATREAVFHALTEPPIVEPTLAKITERLGEFVRRYTLDPAVIDVRADPDNPGAVIVERRMVEQLLELHVPPEAQRLAADLINRRLDDMTLAALAGDTVP